MRWRALRAASLTVWRRTVPGVSSQIRCWPSAIASFNGKFRDECLSMEWFRNRIEAKAVIDQWRRHYITMKSGRISVWVTRPRRPSSNCVFHPPARRPFSKNEWS